MSQIHRFMGTFQCFICSKRVRVYDWLPSCVLCATCTREILRQEIASQSHEDRHGNVFHPKPR